MVDTVIRVENLWKRFTIPHERRTTVFETISGIFKKNRYEELWALKNVEFSVKRGEFVGIIGENGSGKTTLLSIVANVLRPTRGRVSVNGRITPFLELGVGFQPELTARENIHIYGAILGLSEREVKERMEDILEFSALKKFEDTKLKNFSSGMEVRLAFSTAIHTEPEILLIDEALAVGDMDFQQKCFRVFRRFRGSGVTVLFVSHDLNLVRNICDKALYLKDGELADFGETSEVVDNYISHNIYGGMAKFVSDRKEVGDVIVAPEDVLPFLEGELYLDSEVEAHEGGFKAGSEIINPSWLILDKGALESVDPGVLKFAAENLKPVYANEVFVVFSNREELEEVDKESNHYKAFAEKYMDAVHREL